MEIVIDGLKIISEDDFHQIVSEQFKLPNWYGRNLNALWDVLTGMVDRPLKITWINADISRKNIDTFDDIIRIFEKTKKWDEELERKKYKFTYEIIP